MAAVTAYLVRTSLRSTGDLIGEGCVRNGVLRRQFHNSEFVYLSRQALCSKGSREMRNLKRRQAIGWKHGRVLDIEPDRVRKQRPDWRR